MSSDYTSVPGNYSEVSSNYAKGDVTSFASEGGSALSSETVATSTNTVAANANIGAEPAPKLKQVRIGRVLPNPPVNEKMGASAKALSKLVIMTANQDLSSVGLNTGKTVASGNFKSINKGGLTVGGRTLDVAVAVGSGKDMKGDVEIAKALNEAKANVKAEIKDVKEQIRSRMAEGEPVGQLKERLAELKGQLGRLQHVVHYEVAEGPNGKMATVSHWAQGGPLEKTPMRSFEEAHVILQDSADGVQAMHDHGVIHKDLAARNIFLTKHEAPTGEAKETRLRAKVGDLGMGQVLGADGKGTAPRRGPLKWMAPEWLMKGEVSEKTDVFSFGMVIYETLAGTQPYDGYPPEQMAVERCRGWPQTGGKDPLPDQLRRLTGNDDYANLMERCIDPNPDNRPTMKEVSAELQRIAEQGVPDRPIVVPMTANEYQPSYPDAPSVDSVGEGTNTDDGLGGNYTPVPGSEVGNRSNYYAASPRLNDDEGNYAGLPSGEELNPNYTSVGSEFDNGGAITGLPTDSGDAASEIYGSMPTSPPEANQGTNTDLPQPVPLGEDGPNYEGIDLSRESNYGGIDLSGVSNYGTAPARGEKAISYTGSNGEIHQIHYSAPDLKSSEDLLSKLSNNKAEIRSTSKLRKGKRKRLKEEKKVFERAVKARIGELKKMAEAYPKGEHKDSIKEMIDRLKGALDS